MKDRYFRNESKFSNLEASGSFEFRQTINNTLNETIYHRLLFIYLLLIMIVFIVV